MARLVRAAVTLGAVFTFATGCVLFVLMLLEWATSGVMYVDLLIVALVLLWGGGELWREGHGLPWRWWPFRRLVWTRRE